MRSDWIRSNLWWYIHIIDLLKYCDDRLVRQNNMNLWFRESDLRVFQSNRYLLKMRARLDSQSGDYEIANSTGWSSWRGKFNHPFTPWKWHSSSMIKCSLYNCLPTAHSWRRQGTKIGQNIANCAFPNRLGGEPQDCFYK